MYHGVFERRREFQAVLCPPSGGLFTRTERMPVKSGSAGQQRRDTGVVEHPRFRPHARIGETWVRKLAIYFLRRPRSKVVA